MIKTQLGQDIIKMYKPYENNSTKWVKSMISNEPVIVYDRYEVKQLLGKGAYGIVVAAQDKMAKDSDRSLVAIKKINKAFEHKIFTRRTLRELKLLKLLQHENIIRIETILQPKSRQEFDDIYVVFEMMQTDLHTIIKNKMEPLPPQKYKFLLYQILRGLKYIHSAKIVHRDLKPRNLLINKNADLKICDFGLGRYIDYKPKAYVLTDYVTTRWYRAPQLLLGCNTYETSVDIWSVGCILAEMILRKPFLPGSATQEQIELICQVLGPPDLENIKHIPPKNIEMVKLISKRKKKVKQFETIFEGAPKQAIDLVKKMLVFNPDKRITVQDALKHPFLEELHLQQDEPTCKHTDIAEFDFEDHNLTTQQLKDLLYEQILLYNNKQFAEQYEAKKKAKQSLIAHILSNSNASNINPITDEDDQQEDPE